MKVKIGDEVYDSLKHPIMIIFDEGEQKQITSMKELKKFCSYPTEGYSQDVIEEFMNSEKELF